MGTKIIPVLLACLSFALSGCVTYKAIDTTKSVDVGDGVSVDPKAQWADVRLPVTGGIMWTIDGIGLDELHFWTGIKSGSAIIQVSGQHSESLATYNSTMLPNDVADALASALTKMGYAQVRTANLAPAPFGSDRGFRFDLTLATADGLEMKGVVLAAQRNAKLDLILFIAPAEYYYARYAATVDQIFASVRAGSSATPRPTS